MKPKQPKRSNDVVYQHLVEQITLQHGVLLDSQALVQVLRYPSLTALDQAVRRGHLRVPVITIPNRRGQFVLTIDLCKWLASMHPGSELDRLGRRNLSQ